MSRKQVVVLALVIAVGAAMVLGIKVLSSPAAMPDHLTIAQAKAMTGQAVTVGGEVVPGSISWDNASQSLRFFLSSDGDRMQVVYQGPAPGDFKPGMPLAAEGTYDASGVFRARTLTMRNSPLCKTCHAG